MKYIPLGFLIISSVLAGAGPATARSEVGALEQRLERMERDMTTLQRQLFRGEKPSGGVSVTNSSTANFDSRLSQIEEQLRQLQGQIEQQDFQNRQNAATLKQVSDDMEFRLRELEERAAAASPPPAPTVNETPEASEGTPSEEESQQPSQYTPAAQGKYASAREHYNQAFKLLNQADYEGSQAEFESFIASYKDDRLVGNAYYWLGETHYVQRQFVKAADYFRRGFEAMPSGPKAPDNLLKLAMSLSFNKQNKEACVVLGQLVQKYGAKSPTIQQKAGKERVRIGCE